MAGYMILGTFREGVPDMGKVDDDLRDVKASIEKMNIRLVGLWGLMGRFDMLVVIDAPNDMSAVGAAQVIARKMNASTETQRAFAEEELTSMGAGMKG